MQNPEQHQIQTTSPGAEWDREFSRKALDELFSLARQYKTTEAYRKLLDFIRHFRFYSPFNAMLIHLQLPGATFVAPLHRWLRDYGRRIKAGARPLVILQPMGPVMFVYDVSHTEPEDGAPPLPPQVVRPFEVRRGQIRGELHRTIENARRDGVDVAERAAGSQSAGVIHTAQPGRSLAFLVKEKPEREFVEVPLRYELLLNSKHSAPAKYATLAHELGHLYCGHLGTPNVKWWPKRCGLPYAVEEFEAESICFLVCSRLGIDNPSDEYLAHFMKENEAIPSISLDCVIKAAGLIEQMGRGRLKPRKER
jgi:hypothetical protein